MMMNKAGSFAFSGVTQKLATDALPLSPSLGCGFSAFRRIKGKNVRKMKRGQIPKGLLKNPISVSF